MWPGRVHGDPVPSASRITSASSTRMVRSGRAVPAVHERPQRPEGTHAPNRRVGWSPTAPACSSHGAGPRIGVQPPRAFSTSASGSAGSHQVRNDGGRRPPRRSPSATARRHRSGRGGCGSRSRCGRGDREAGLAQAAAASAVPGARARAGRGRRRRRRRSSSRA